MAKKNPKRRSAPAVAAILRSGSGKHADKRYKRKRTRSAKKRAAIREQTCR